MPWRLADRWLAPVPEPARVGWLGKAIYAHRGLHGEGRVENSPSAFAAALAASLGIECDVRLSADGRVVVFHDAELDRLTGETGLVASRSLVELAAVQLDGSEDFIPSLSDLLVLVAGRVPLLIEVKTARDRPVDALCEAVRSDLVGYAGPHAVMSFDPRVGAWFGRHARETGRGLVVTERGERSLSDRIKRHLFLWQARPDFLAYDIRDLPSAFAAAQRERGLPLLTWTVATPALAERAAIYADAPIAEGEGVAPARVAP